MLVRPMIQLSSRHTKINLAWMSAPEPFAEDFWKTIFQADQLEKFEEHWTATPKQAFNVRTGQL